MTTTIAETYRRFAREEARGRSPLYEALTESVADDPDMLAHLADLPSAKQQPNLLLAAARHVPGFRGTGLTSVALCCRDGMKSEP